MEMSVLYTDAVSTWEQQLLSLHTNNQGLTTFSYKFVNHSHEYPRLR